MHPSSAPIAVRPGRVEDVDVVRAIRNDAISNSTALWTTATESRVQTAAIWAELVGRGAAYVAELDGEVLGYACWTQWRPKEGYRYSFEDSVYVLAGHHGRGIGRLLLAAVIDAAREAGGHLMIADIEAGNAASIALHARLGFETIATLREVGTKFDRWLDLTIMRREL